jgi:hypothetical protein
MGGQNFHLSCKYTFKQGGQMGRYFASWAIICYGSFFITKVAKVVGLRFSMVKLIHAFFI